MLHAPAQAAHAGHRGWGDSTCPCTTPFHLVIPARHPAHAPGRSAGVQSAQEGPPHRSRAGRPQLLPGRATGYRHRSRLPHGPTARPRARALRRHRRCWPHRTAQCLCLCLQLSSASKVQTILVQGVALVQGLQCSAPLGAVRDDAWLEAHTTRASAVVRGRGDGAHQRSRDPGRRCQAQQQPAQGPGGRLVAHAQRGPVPTPEQVRCGAHLCAKERQEGT